MFRMKIRRFAFVLACAVPVFTAAQATKRPAATTKVLTTYTDPANGVSFKYPAAWTIVREPSFYLPPLISLPQQSPQAVVSLSPSGDYLKTNLGGLEFTYVTLRLPSQASCLQRITEDIREDNRSRSMGRNSSIPIQATRDSVTRPIGTSTRPIAMERAFSSKPPSTRSVPTPTTAEPNSLLTNQKFSRALSMQSSRPSKSGP
jgi:hypothetical protein